MVGSLVIVLLRIFSWFWQWNNFENRLIFDKVKAFKNLCHFIGPPCMWAIIYFYGIPAILAWKGLFNWSCFASLLICCLNRFYGVFVLFNTLHVQFLPRDARSASAVLLSYVVRLSVCLSVCPSVTLTYRGHIGSTRSKLITRIISLGSLLLGPTTSAI